jgi:cytosine/adenosine deaminase-related metal-dependent hydrolase
MDSERTVYSSGAVAISGNKIIAVGRDRDISPLFNPKESIHAHGAPVHPGFFDCHAHVTFHTLRGSFPDPIDQTRNILYHALWENALDDNDEHVSAKLACLEMLHNGITNFLDPGTVFETDAVAEAITEVGIRGSLGPPWLWDHGDSQHGTAVSRAPFEQARAIKLLSQQLWRNADSNARVRGHVALYGNGTASDDLLRAAKACADEYQTFLTMHQSFAPQDIKFDDDRFGVHPLVHYAELGVLGRNCCFAHMNAVRDDEIPPILKSEMTIAWVPANCLFWGTSFYYRPRMAELYARGVPIGLGTDIAKTWAFDEQAQVGYLSVRGTLGFLSAEALLEMATLCGAKAMGVLGSLGSLEVGKQADIVIRTNDVPEAHPNVDPIRNLMLIARGKSVRTVIVAGQIVLKEGRPTRLDEASVFDEADESAARIATKVGLRPGTRWRVID